MTQLARSCRVGRAWPADAALAGPCGLPGDRVRAGRADRAPRAAAGRRSGDRRQQGRRSRRLVQRPRRDDGWPRGARSGPHFVRFECTQPGRPARLSRAFGVDGRKTEAIVLGLWIRAEQHPDRRARVRRARPDDRLSGRRSCASSPAESSARGPTPSRDRWTRVVKRIPVPPGTKDAIMSVGLMGATGTLDIDGLTVDLVPVARRRRRTSSSTATSSWATRPRSRGSPKVTCAGSSPVLNRRRRSS